jgi:hypothetical protein
MDKDRTRVQKYVSKFRSLLDDLLEAYRSDPSNDALHARLASRSLFLACKLGLVKEKELDWQGMVLFAPLGWPSFDLSKDAHDQRWVQQQQELRADREKRIRDFQAKAMSLADKDFSLGAPSTVDRTNLVEDVKKFCDYIEDVIEIYETPHKNAEIHRFGNRANNLALKIGLMCQDRRLAHACRIARSEDKIPYVEEEWWSVKRMFASELDMRPVERWRAWQRRAKALVETSGTHPILRSSQIEARPDERHQKKVAPTTQYDFFICHASEDKDDFVRPLAKKLKGLSVKVWYDEFTLKVGNSLRESIDYGLKNSRYGVVVLSNSFFKKNWPQQELNGLVTRETGENKVILPIWHGVTKEHVSQYSPILADKIALVSASMSLDEIATKLVEKLSPPS